jgi:hypothetical protein
MDSSLHSGHFIFRLTSSKQLFRCYSHRPEHSTALNDSIIAQDHGGSVSVIDNNQRADFFSGTKYFSPPAVTAVLSMTGVTPANRKVNPLFY